MVIFSVHACQVGQTLDSFLTQVRLSRTYYTGRPGLHSARAHTWAAAHWRKPAWGSEAPSLPAGGAWPILTGRHPWWAGAFLKLAVDLAVEAGRGTHSARTGLPGFLSGFLELRVRVGVDRGPARVRLPEAWRRGAWSSGAYCAVPVASAPGTHLGP